MSATDFLSRHCPNGVMGLLRLFQENGHQAYPVGGCVRDALMHTLPHDWDVAVTCPPDETLALCKSSGYRVIPTGLAHGTVTVLCNGQPVECTTCRADSTYSDGRHPDAVSFTNRLEDDLSRRDFTVNAMAARLNADGSFDIIDRFGGQADLQAGIIRCVGEPTTRFTEDALRILRAVRFAVKLGFDIEPATRKALTDTAPRLALISRERVRTELEGILQSPDPVRGVRLLDELGLYGYVFPNCTAPQNPDALHALPNIFSLRLAALLSNQQDNCAQTALASLRLSNRTVEEVKQYLAPLPCALEASPLCARRMRQQFGDWAVGRVQLWAALSAPAKRAVADELTELIRASELAGECVTTRGLAVNGKDLIESGLFEGAAVGDALERLLAYVIQEPTHNQKQLLLDYLRGE